MQTRYRDDPYGHHKNVIAGLESLRHALRMLEDCRQTAPKVRRAIASALGAQRHAEHVVRRHEAILITRQQHGKR